MNKELFFNVWGIYYNHFGKEQQEYQKKLQASRLLQKTFDASHKIRALKYMYTIIKLMWEMDLFTQTEDIMVYIKNISEACLNEEYSDRMDMDPYYRLQNNVHMSIKQNCEELDVRHWRLLNRPKIPYNLNNMNDSVYRVSSIIAL